MPFLDMTFYGNTTLAWGMALAVAVGVFMGLKIVNAVVIRHLTALSERTNNDVDDLAASVLGRTSSAFLLLVGVFAGSHFLTLPDGAQGAVATVVTLGLFIQTGLWANVGIAYVLRRQADRFMEEDAATATTLRFAGFLARLLVWVIVLLVALDNLDIDITALVTGLGIGGIAVALAVQNVLGDLFASLSIVLDKPFVIGDFIIVGDLMGTVEHIGLKTTRVRSLSGEQLVFANNDLLNSRIRNYKRMMERRVIFGLGVVYGTPREKLEAIPDMVEQTIEAHENARFDRAHFKSFGGSSLDFEIVYYVLDPDYNAYMDIQQAINLAVYRRFEEEGIEFAFPTQTLHLESVPAGDLAGVTGRSTDTVPAGGGTGGVPAE